MMKPPEIHPSELYHHLGKSLCAAQVLDHVLAHCLTFWLKLPAAESRQMIESSLKNTLGQLLTALRKHDLVPDGFDGRLEDYKNERNWLVHRLYSENYEDIFSPTLVPQLVDRISGVHAEAKALVRTFDSLNDQWFDKRGLPRQALEEEMARRLDEINRQQFTVTTGAPQRLP